MIEAGWPEPVTDSAKHIHMTVNLNIIISSTMSGRVGAPVGAWCLDFAKGHGGFDTERVDLAAFDLPLYDEPHHPRLRKYQHEHTRRWGASVESADAYVFVTPEYNHGPTPAQIGRASCRERVCQEG